MSLFLFLGVVLIIVLVYKIFFPFGGKRSYFEIEHIDTKKIDEPHEHYPYVKRSYLMTAAEFNFYKVLREIIQDRYYIIPQVALSKLVSVDKHEMYRKTFNNKIDRKSVDFVLFSKPVFSPVMIIELDDSSHLRALRQGRDRFVDQVARQTGIKIAHIKTSYHYNPIETEKLLSEAK